MSLRVARAAAGVLILALVVWRLGTGPIVAGLRSIDVGALLLAAAIAALTTVCAAWRWRVVARSLGVDLPLATAVAAYYRSQFLNAALPGGVVGDVERGLRSGRDAGDVARGLRAVGWERLAGQLVQLVVALVVLVALPSPVHAVMLVVVGGAAVAIVATVVALTLVRRRWSQALAADVRGCLGEWPVISLASLLVVAGHAATFLLAARTAGSKASTLTLLPLALLVLLAMVVPLSVGGWGPREGAAAWLFGAAGLGAGQGVAVATVYGVMVLVASLPGVVVLVLARRGRQPQPWPVEPTERALVGAGGGRG